MDKRQIKSVGLIMDGNRRWAVENRMAKIEGHKYGAEKIPEILDWAMEKGIKDITLYAFSTENWNRTKLELDTIMLLFEKFIVGEIDRIISKKTSIKFIGKKEMFSKKLQKIMVDAEEKSKGFDRNLYLAMSYGGRLEIVEAVKKLSQEKTKEEISNITEEEFEKFLWSGEMIDPEIIIRTGGDTRLSNFLMWKSAYSEIVFTDTKWPDFSKEEFDKILENYQRVKINKGK